MDNTALLHRASENNDAHIFLLFEAGAQTLDDFRAFHSQNEKIMYSLYIHPQLKEFQEYGPWLLEPENKSHLPNYLDAIPGVLGVILARRHLSSIAIQLSKGCTVVGPENKTSLVRFYAQNVLKLLALSANREWHAFLFRDIDQWWIPGTPGREVWEPAIIPASTAPNPADPTVRLEKEIWHQLAERTDVSNVLLQWQQMASSQHFPPCSQRDMVIKALDKAKDAGLIKGEDIKLYALYYLDGGKNILEAEQMKIPLLKASEGKLTLEQVLKNFAV